MLALRSQQRKQDFLEQAEFQQSQNYLSVKNHNKSMSSSIPQSDEMVSLILFGQLHKNQEYERKIKSRLEPFRHGKPSIQEINSYFNQNLNESSRDLGSFASQKQRSSSPKIINQPYSDVKYEETLRPREVIKEIGVGQFKVGQIKRNSLDCSIKLDHNDSSYIDKSTMNDQNNSSKVNTHGLNVNSSMNRSIHTSHSGQGNGSGGPISSSNYEFNTNSSYFLCARSSPQSRHQQKLIRDQERQREKEYKTSFRISLGGIRDKQGWSEIKDGINVGDVYNEGFQRSGSLTRQRRKELDVTNKEFKQVFYPEQIREHKARSVNRSNYVNDTHKALTILNESVNPEIYNNSTRQSQAKILGKYDSNSSISKMPKLYLKSLEQSELLQKFHQNLQKVKNSKQRNPIVSIQSPKETTINSNNWNNPILISKQNMIQIDELNDYASLNQETPKYNDTKESFLSKGMVEKMSDHHSNNNQKPARRNILIYKDYLNGSNNRQTLPDPKTNIVINKIGIFGNRQKSIDLTATGLKNIGVSQNLSNSHKKQASLFKK
ncbi:UNKNOWN [Stylonychia lemnae]|uniref:Uncharacterized protein n=1 Tax=Stylonychia lemnae TaxID=5949 RepID=A0A078B909_STYLE|nr:UNKNOWN [Stylonychia lemnae]|eukprot:CDW90726.1 UNKNOWN [Stylonychia lemnae]